jgi:outer membrane protein insertion porin family
LSGGKVDVFLRNLFSLLLKKCYALAYLEKLLALFERMNFLYKKKKEYCLRLSIVMVVLRDFCLGLRGTGSLGFRNFFFLWILWKGLVFSKDFFGLSVIAFAAEQGSLRSGPDGHESQFQGFEKDNKAKVSLSKGGQEVQTSKESGSDSLVIAEEVTPDSSAYTIQEILVHGPARSDQQAVIEGLGLDLTGGKTYRDEDLDHAVKRLYATGLYSNVSLKVEGRRLIVTVAENQIINRIALEGNKKIDDDLLMAEIGISPRDIYNPLRVQEVSRRIVQIYHAKGYLSAQVRPRIIAKSENRVDLVFEICEGDKSYVRRIVFLGNQGFSSSQLADVISTKIARWYRFFVIDDTYDQARVAQDEQLLRQFYMDQGYADFQVAAAIGELFPNHKDFLLTFKIQEGPRYRFGQMSIKSRLLAKVDTACLGPFIACKKGRWFNRSRIQKTVVRLTKALQKQGVLFVEVDPVITKRQECIDVCFELKDSPSQFVQRIIFEGNLGTNDEVLRREMTLKEGDALVDSVLIESRENLESLDFFEMVDLKTEEGPAPDRKNVRVVVKEKSTGDIEFGGGYSTSDGPLLKLGYSDRNFLGKGQEWRINGYISRRGSDVSMGLTEPYFFGMPIAAGGDVFLSRYLGETKGDFSKSGSYEQRMGGFTSFASYLLRNNLRQFWTLRARHERVRIQNNSQASPFLLASCGSTVVSSVGHELLYGRIKRSGPIPYKGRTVRLISEFFGVVGSIRYAQNSVRGNYFYPLDQEKRWVFQAQAQYGIIGKIGRLRLIDRYMVGGTSTNLGFLGFTNGGIGPRDKETGEALGGKQYYMASLKLFTPLGFPKELSVRGVGFFKMGSLWDSGELNTDLGYRVVSDGFYNRITAGAGVVWNSPMGNIGFLFTGRLRRWSAIDPQASWKNTRDLIDRFVVVFGEEW